MFFPPMRSSKLTSRITCPLRRDVRYSSQREASPDGYGPLNRFTSCLEALPRNSLFAEEVPELRRGGDPIGPGTFRRIEHLHPTHFGVESSVDAALAREPQHATLIEHSGVQVRAFAPGRQWIDADFLGHGIDAHDGVQTAVRNPGRAVRADDHAVRP